MDGVPGLAEAVDQSGVTFVMGYTWRSMPIIRSFKKAIDSGQYGTPRELVVVSGSHWPKYRPAYRVVPYFQRRESGGGVIQDGLTHLFNLGEWFVGPITELTADHAYLLLEGITIEDTAHVIARHGALLASYTFNLTQMHGETSITIITDKGSLRIENHKNRWRWMNEPDGKWQDTEFPDIERDAPYVDQVHAFLDAIESKGPIRCTLEEGISTLKVNLAALKADDERNWQTIER